VDPRRAVGDGDSALFLNLAVERGETSHARTSGPRSRPVGGLRKRVFDVVFASVVLIVLAPIIAVVAAWIRIANGGPVFFSHCRVGFDGKLFGCLKFRTMVLNGEQLLQAHLASDPQAASEWSQFRKLRRDPRVTVVGEFLRKSSLDELPQLVNVIRGEMSCVGPRPVMVDELERYGLNLPDYLRARPGLTGLWQVGGRSDVDYENRVRLDVEYVREWCLRKDFNILIRTIPAILNTNGSC
jgi:exopolysaccharide production protein ExoY